MRKMGLIILVLLAAVPGIVRDLHIDQQIVML
jgi:hypothetical protein